MTRDVLAESFRIFKRDPWRFMLLAAVVTVPNHAVPPFAPGHWRLLVGVAFAVVAYPLAGAAVVDAVRERQSGRRITFGSYRRVGARFVQLLFASIAAFIGMVVALLLLVVPGLFAIARWSVFVPVIVMEPTPNAALGALSRSNRLVRGHTWVAFWIILLPTLAAFAIQAPNLVFHNVAVAWFNVAISTAAVTYASIAGAVFYARLAPLGPIGESPSLVRETPVAVLGTGTGSPPLSAAEAARRRLWTP
jgi:hypothetical protein